MLAAEYASIGILSARAAMRASRPAVPLQDPAKRTGRTSREARRPDNFPTIHGHHPVRAVLQLGIFRRIEDAEAFCAELKAAGVEAKTEAIRLGSAASPVRVFVGPLVNCEQLAAAQAELSARQLRFMEIRLQ